MSFGLLANFAPFALARVADPLDAVMPCAAVVEKEWAALLMS